MTNADRDLASHERLIYQTQLHWIVLVPPFFVGAVLAAAGLWVFAQPTDIAHRRIEFPIDPGWLGILIVIVGIVVIGLGILRRESTELTVTTRKVTATMGVIARRTLEIVLPHVESIEVDEGVWGRLLGYGTVVVRGTGGTPETLTTIAHAREFRRQVQQQLAAPPLP
jgi:uncharacterized membrane protein YdbT with pleckstrin-like domain